MITNVLDMKRVIEDVNHSSKLISICIPTRNRVDNLRDAVIALQSTASDLSQIEFVFRVDEDDTETIEYASTVKNATVIIGKSLGYAAHHERHDDMTRIASGQYLLFTSDDMMYKSSNWDKCIKRHDGEVAVVFFGNDYTMAVHASIPKILGKIAIQPFSIDLFYKHFAMQTQIYAGYPIGVDHTNRSSPNIPEIPHVPMTDHLVGWVEGRKETAAFIQQMKQVLTPITGFVPTGIHLQPIIEAFGEEFGFSVPNGFVGPMPPSIG